MKYLVSPDACDAPLVARSVSVDLSFTGECTRLILNQCKSCHLIMGIYHTLSLTQLQMVYLLEILS